MSSLQRANIRAKHVIMMISAKGGVGKSTLAVNLAAALAQRGQRVGIFDADIHGPNVPALLGVRQKRDLQDNRNPLAMMPVEARPDALDMRPIAPLERYGMEVMSLALLVGDKQAINPTAKEVGKLIGLLFQRVAWNDADIVLIDMPPGTGEPLQTLLDWGLVDGAVVVTTREQLAHLDNGRLLDLFKRRGLPVFGVVENMTHVSCPKCGELIELYPQPAESQAVYADTPILGAMPFHPDMIRVAGVGAPIALRDPASTTAAPLLSLADAVLGKLSVAQPAPTVEDECEDCP